jgi:hypothetical protein
MAWERRGSRRFYYTAVRRDGRVAKRCLGAGAVAELTAALHAQARRDRAAAAAALRAEAKRLAELDRRGRDLDRLCARLVEAHLLLAGFHRPNYGPWRRRRGRG